MEAEHPVEAQMIADFIISAVSGKLPSGAKPKTPSIDPNKIVESWSTEGTMSFPGIGPNKRQPLTPNDMFYHAVGSTWNPDPILFLEKDINGKKGSIFGGDTGLGDSKINSIIKRMSSDGPDKGNRKLLLGEYPRVSLSGGGPRSINKLDY